MESSHLPLDRLVELEAPDVTLVLDAYGRITFASSGIDRVLGWKRAALMGQLPVAYVDADDQPQVERDLARAQSGVSATSTFRFRCLDGSARWVEANWRRAPDGSGNVVAAVRDISERQSEAVALREQLTLDPLTGIGNRGLFADRLQHALRRLSRTPGRLAVLMLDVDQFKVVNDALGHAAGDQVLAQLASRLLTQMRPGDTFARLGGDEFAILAEDIDGAGGALRLGQRITSATQVPLRVGDDEFAVSVSVGVAVTDRAGQRPEELMRQADLALYRAKDRGRDRAELFDDELRTRDVSRLTVERMLRRAVLEQRLLVEYQPIVSLTQDAVVGAEALVRVSDLSARRTMLPGEFLEVAEETGLVKDIDDFVLREATRECARWSGAAWVTVNVTARNLAGGRLIDSVLALCAEQGIGAEFVRVELVERVLLGATHSAISTLHALREAGVQVGLDDFGTGYSSLTHLRQLPLDFVKLDRSVVDGIAPGSTDLAMTVAVTGMCHAIGLTVVAEGVERPVQEQLLRTAGCDLAQGLLYGASMAAEELAGRIGGPSRQRTP